MKNVLAGIALVLAATTAGAISSDRTVTLQLTVFPCAADAAAAPALSLWSMQRPPQNMNLAPDWQRAGSVWQASLALAPGRYMIGAGSSHCTGGYAQWIALPGAPRHLAFTLNKQGARTIGGSFEGLVYGYLPVPVATVDVVPSDDSGAQQTRRSVPTDGDTYQIGFLRPGRYVVRVSFGDVTASHDVTVGRTFDSLTVRADLTTGDGASIVRQEAEGSRFVRAPNAQQTHAVAFELGSASAGGWTTSSSASPGEKPH